MTIFLSDSFSGAAGPLVGHAGATGGAWGFASWSDPDPDYPHFVLDGAGNAVVAAVGLVTEYEIGASVACEGAGLLSSALSCTIDALPGGALDAESPRVSLSLIGTNVAGQVAATTATDGAERRVFVTLSCSGLVDDHLGDPLATAIAPGVAFELALTVSADGRTLALYVDGALVESYTILHPDGFIGLSAVDISAGGAVSCYDKLRLHSVTAQSAAAAVVRCTTWEAAVRVGGVDMADATISDIEIEAEEGAARVASLTIFPAPGTVISASTFTGKTVAIDYTDGAASGQLFTGVVDLPAINLVDRSITLHCTDDLQGRISALTAAEVDALVGGTWSPVIFDKAATSWARCNDRLSTVPASISLSPAGDFRLSPWAAKSSPDLSFGVDAIEDGSLEVSPAERSGIVNRIDVEFDYRFPRVKSEGYGITYMAVDVTGFATYIAEGRWWLQRDAVANAISSAGGSIQSITYTPLPNENVAVGQGYWSPGPADGELCMGFTATVGFDYAQQIEHNYRITVTNAASVTALGPLPETMSGSLVGEYPDIEAVESSIALYKAEISSVPPTDVAPILAGFTNIGEVALTDDTNKTAADWAMVVLIDIAKVRIYSSHRGTSVSGTVPLSAAVDIDKTIAVDCSGVAAKGKCRRVVHKLSPATGRAVSQFEIAICSVAGVGVEHPADLSTPPNGTPAFATPLTSNPVITFNNGATEDHTITIDFPGVEEAERAKATHTISQTVAAAIAEDLLKVTM